jgi:hypothetical protein
MRIAARGLMTRNRLDIAIKARFFEHLMGHGDPDAERLYCWHIRMRTGGVEPRGGKHSVGDYVAGCRRLLASMQAAGFDAAHPVLYGSNLVLRDGAHRIACAAALKGEVEVCTEAKPSRSRPWDAGELRRHGIGCVDLARIEQDWERLAA